MWTRIFIVALVAVMATGCSAPRAATPPPPAVEVVEAQQKDVPIYGEWVGTLDGLVNADIKAQVSGYLLRQDYHEGSWVKHGQLLFEIDPRTFEAALSQAQGLLDQTRGQQTQAWSQLGQAQAVLAQARSQLRATQAARTQAEALLLQARAALAQALATQHKTDLDVLRYRPLAEKKAVTQQDLDNAVQADLVARAGVEAARAQVASAKGGVESAAAQIGTAQASILSANAQINTAKAAITSAQAQVESATAQVEAARLNLGFTRILSPINGIAGVAHAQVGNLVSSTSDILTTVSTVDPIKVNFTVAEQEYLDAARRKRAAKVDYDLIEADGTVYPRHGRFYSEDRNIAVTTGAIRITAVFPNPSGLLRPGQYARVRAIRYVEKKAILIPQRAVSELQDINQVAVVGSDNKISLRTVQVGQRVGPLWIVRGGLKAGERVVAEGTLKVQPGVVVSPQPYDAKAATKK